MNEYRTYFHISKSYNVSESTAYRCIKWAEDTLIKHPEFALPRRKALLKSDIQYEVVVIDATECPVERPQKKQRKWYSGKKKRHKQKAQVVADKETGKIICTSFEKGRRHDFKLFKGSKVHLHPQTEALADTGYQGLQKIHFNTTMPKKRSKKNPLTKDDKIQNQDIARRRVIAENVIGSIKRFKIIADKYRNRRKRFALRFNLITAFHNFMIRS